MDVVRKNTLRLRRDRATRTLDVPASGVRDATSYAYLLSARSTNGFIEHLRNPESKDYRNLGVLMRFTAVPAAK